MPKDSRGKSPEQTTYRPIGTHTPFALTCIAVITLLQVHASNGQDITTEGGDLKEREQMDQNIDNVQLNLEATMISYDGFEPTGNLVELPLSPNGSEPLKNTDKNWQCSAASVCKS